MKSYLVAVCQHKLTERMLHCLPDCSGELGDIKMLQPAYVANLTLQPCLL